MDEEAEQSMKQLGMLNADIDQKNLKYKLRI